MLLIVKFIFDINKRWHHINCVNCSRTWYKLYLSPHEKHAHIESCKKKYIYIYRLQKLFKNWLQRNSRCTPRATKRREREKECAERERKRARERERNWERREAGGRGGLLAFQNGCGLCGNCAGIGKGRLETGWRDSRGRRRALCSCRN